MAENGGIPKKCQGVCPLEKLDNDITRRIVFSRNCAGPVIVADDSVQYEFDIDSNGTVTEVVTETRKVGTVACTNTGAGIYLEKTTAGENI